ncbi:cupin domain-containing protein [Mucilaginibacter gotjawali]|uniref:Mannose-6-phosphate isomerase-like protein (Cupin superfamily) n=1 Tax=Mucilaginibacter gotjawali TaxID=1550579 RepID=A0A839SKH4_9SPHI|nr:cupin domain-containing protein [Mucilaginibacter gotjawali]MBB3057039.1 mannose-6-phosphate isomerase-like protein (cupin superfamily) [Mucilaginibacter gotjawali]
MNKHITSTQNAQHYTWGDQCDSWYLLRSDSLAVIQERMPPGAAEQMHYHDRAQQVFYILQGTATFEVENETVTVQQGQSIHFAPKMRHRILNNSSTDLHFLVISEPKSHGDRVNV